MARSRSIKTILKAIPERPEFAEVAKPAVFSQDQHQAAKTTAMAPVTEESQPLDAPLAAATEPTGAVTDPAPDMNGTSSVSAPTTDPEPVVTTSAPVDNLTATAATAAKTADQNVQTATLPADPLPVEQVAKEKTG